VIQHAELAPIAVPLPALQQHLAALGKTGSGKTFAVKGIVEHLLALERRVCILDPTGAWWGLLSSADGRRDGFPVTVFGGDHAHVPITEHAGHAVGELVGTGNVPAIIDLSGTTLGERHRFVERFAETLFRVNKKPLHLVIDEADEFAPQSGAPGTERMLGAIDRIVRRGRIKGFRVIMISQRPAVLNKNVLTQANTLIAMRLPSSQDRKAIELWVKGQADEAQADQLLGSLASLKKGEGWVWAPELGVLERRTFPAIATFDSSRTPDDGEAIDPPKRLADVDLDAVNAAMAKAIEEAEANDITVLKARILKLQGELTKALRTPVVQNPGNVEKQIEEAVKRATERADRNLREIAAAGEMLEHHARATAKGVEDLRAMVLGSVSKASPAHAASGLPPGPISRTLPLEVIARGRMDIDEARQVERASAPAGNDALPAPHQKILDALAWWWRVRIEQPSRPQVAAIAGYSPTGGTFNRYLSALSSGGFITYPDAGTVRFTDRGYKQASRQDGVFTRDELHRRAMEVLDSPHRKIMRVLLDAGGDELGRTNVGELSGYEATGGTFNRYLSHLSSVGMVRYPRRTTVAAAEWLFPKELT